MAKTGRNDPCPCGSGKKYKACCLTNDAAAERERLATEQSKRDERAAARRLRMQEFEAAIAAQIAGAEDDEDDELTTASNAAVALVRASKLDEAETAARDLLLHYPDVPDGWDRLGMVHEARGEHGQAADCYRKVLDVIRQHPGDYDAAYDENFVKLIAKLDPPPAT